MDVIENSNKILPYLDIPMQHANNALLKKMNRRGTKEDVIDLVKEIRSRFPEATLRTTAIVGFPQESDADFEELIDFIQEIKWDRFGAFTYSKEEDTPAYSLEGEIEPEVAKARLDRLMAVQKEISLKKNKAKIGKRIEVLVEEKEALKKQYRGRSKADAPDEVDGQVIFTSPKEIALGEFVTVLITDAAAYDLFGEQVIE